MKTLTEGLQDKLRLQKDGTLYWGAVDSYAVILNSDEDMENIKGQIYYENRENKEELNSFLSGLKEEGFLEFYQQETWGCHFLINDNGETEPAQTLLQIFEKLREFDCKPVCSSCQKEQLAHFIKINGNLVNICSACTEKLITEEEMKKTRSYSYLTGTIGALVGALAGSLVWALIGVLGYIAAVGGYAIGAASAFGYKKFRGKPDKIMIIITVIAVLAGLFSGQILTVLYFLIQEYGEVTFTEVLSWIPLLLTDGEFMMEIMKDSIMGVLFAGMGCFSLFKRMVKETANQEMVIERV